MDVRKRDRREPDAETVEAQAADAGCDVRVSVRTGRPADEVLSYADEHDIDPIVVGTHGRTGLRQSLVGSVALTVIRDARISVLTVGSDTVWTAPYRQCPARDQRDVRSSGRDRTSIINRSGMRRDRSHTVRDRRRPRRSGAPGKIRRTRSLGHDGCRRSGHRTRPRRDDDARPWHTTPHTMSLLNTRPRKMSICS
ncbi:universal stress protein [Salinadaptatus halalkaliphilus]|uniref:Universal stress protein n=1 Tax=Salinadaptatus halalkaliphilus TaxID=2419781 RepID=A0A4V3VKX2_9EURY|nr:universal stress protein [Salinadaptatus halalkaliphilus]